MEEYVLATIFAPVLMDIVGQIVKIRPVQFVVKMVVCVQCLTTNANVEMAITEQDATKSNYTFIFKLKIDDM